MTMQSTEQTAFFQLIDQLCAAFDRPPARDEMREAYWNALHDVRLSEIRGNIDRLIKLATRDSKFPRPGDLRDLREETPSQKSASAEAAFRDALRRNGEMWQEWHDRDPEEAALEHGIALAGRILSCEHAGTPQYAEALREDRQLRDRRRELLQSRVAG